MSEDPATITISSGSVLNAEEIAKKTFPPARRGVDPEAVRRYLEAIAGEVRTLGEREQALRRMLADAERRAAEPELDQATLTKAVGAETARVLQAAHEAAAGVVANGESRARELVEEAEQAASRRREAAEAAAKAMLDEAEGQASALSSSSEAAATTLREDTVAEVAALTEMTQAEAVSLLDSTKAECRQMLREARELRATVLKDLGERRRALFVQLEQLRSGRDSLVEMVGDVGSVVDGLRERLAGAEHEARLAAAEAGERATYKDEAAGGEAAPGAAPVTPISEVAGAGSQVAEELGLDVSVVEAAMAEVVEPGEEEEEVRARETAASYRSVDELFARIRAERAAGAAEVAEDAPPGAAEDVPAGDVPAGDVPAEEVPAEDVPAEEEIAAVGEVVVGASEGPVGADEAGGEEPRGEDDAAYGEEPVSASDYGHLGRRSELLDPLTVKLSRALKRALQDDQNELLTALRNSAGAPNLANLLPEADQKARYTAATLELLGEAWSLGLGWLSGGGQDQDGSVAPPGSTEQGPAAAGTTLASELANELSGLLRRRMVEALETVDDTANGAAGDAASAAYREWKGQRVEALAGDFTTRAFGRGAVAGGKGLSVRWIADDQGAPCSDCDDNVLAGEQQVGEAFPTGQLHPPVHPGCRCLIVAANL